MPTPENSFLKLQNSILNSQNSLLKPRNSIPTLHNSIPVPHIPIFTTSTSIVRPPNSSLSPMTSISVVANSLLQPHNPSWSLRSQLWCSRPLPVFTLSCFIFDLLSTNSTMSNLMQAIRFVFVAGVMLMFRRVVGVVKTQSHETLPHNLWPYLTLLTLLTLL